MYCFSKCCRLCLRKDNTLVKMNWSGSDGIPFLDKLGLIAPSLVANPRNYMMIWICEQCRKRINKAYNFVQHCYKIDAVLDEYCKQLTNADIAQNKCSVSEESDDIKLTEYMIKELTPISVKEECFEDLPVIDDDQYYFESTITIEKHEVSLADFEYIKLESSELEEEADLDVGDASNEEIMVSEFNRDPAQNIQINQAAGTSGENYISSCFDVPNDAKNRTDDNNMTTSNPSPENQSIKSRISLNKHRFKCAICSKTFTRSTTLKVHQRVHSGERPFNCNICNKTFIYSGHLKEHEKIHTGECPKCNICNKTFTESGNLKKHKRVHSGERPFKCNICNKAFTQSVHLKAHDRVHTGERPFKCDICKKTFIQFGNLKDHERIHSGERPFKCNVCNKKFMHSGNLKEHKRVHSGESPFRCNICNKKFNRSSILKEHERVHSGEHLFKCNICNKRFVYSGSLKRHERVHSLKNAI